MSTAACESDAERCGDRPAALECCGEPVLSSADLSDAARWARACHPAYAGRIRFPLRLSDPPAAAENW
ncbi:MAG TPA: hypothetical protein VII47_10635 [Actinomycetota bacterium]